MNHVQSLTKLNNLFNFLFLFYLSYIKADFYYDPTIKKEKNITNLCLNRSNSLILHFDLFRKVFKNRQFKSILWFDSFLWVVYEHFFNQVNYLYLCIGVEFQHSLLDTRGLYFLDGFFLHFHCLHIIQ